jgi:hypothetical protein
MGDLFVPPLITEFAFATRLQPWAQDRLLTFDGTNTYGRSKEWIVSFTNVIYVECPDLTP